MIDHDTDIAPALKHLIKSKLSPRFVKELLTTSNRNLSVCIELASVWPAPIVWSVIIVGSFFANKQPSRIDYSLMAFQRNLDCPLTGVIDKGRLLAMALWSLSVSDFVSSFVTSRFDQHWRGLLFCDARVIIKSRFIIGYLPKRQTLKAIKVRRPPWWSSERNSARMCNARPALSAINVREVINSVTFFGLFLSRNCSVVKHQTTLHHVVSIKT